MVKGMSNTVPIGRNCVLQARGESSVQQNVGLVFNITVDKVHTLRYILHMTQFNWNNEKNLKLDRERGKSQFRSFAFILARECTYCDIFIFQEVY